MLTESEVMARQPEEELAGGNEADGVVPVPDPEPPELLLLLTALIAGTPNG